MNHSIQAPTVVFSGGGSGGHVFPGLAMARCLADTAPKLKIVFASIGREAERRLIREAGFEYLTIPSRPAPRRLSEILPFLATAHTGYRAARRFLDRHSVRLVVGLGGYASVPMARAAANRSIPLVLLEQNAVPGRANRWLARRADVLCAAFAEVKHHLPPHCHWRVTGNPVRASFLTVRRPEFAESFHSIHPAHEAAARRRPWPPLPTDLTPPTDGVAPPPIQRPKQLLVLGGSRGARWLNANVPLALAEIRAKLAGWQVVHQTGSDDHEMTAATYRQLGIDATVRPFLENMAKTLASTDAAVCRAGGSTLAELAVSGVPAVLVPYPHAADDHQLRNAEIFANAGACFLYDQRWDEDRPERALAEQVARLVSNHRTRIAMGDRIRTLAHPDAAADIAAMIQNMLSQRDCCAPPPRPRSAA